MKAESTTTYFHPDSQIVLKELTDAESGILFKALANYTESGVIPQFEERIMRLAFNLFMVNIDRKREAYQQRCEQNRRIAQKREEQRKREQVQQQQQQQEQQQEQEQDLFGGATEGKN